MHCVWHSKQCNERHLHYLSPTSPRMRWLAQEAICLAACVGLFLKRRAPAARARRLHASGAAAGVKLVRYPMPSALTLRE